MITSLQKNDESDKERSNRPGEKTDRPAPAREDSGLEQELSITDKEKQCSVVGSTLRINLLGFSR